MRFDFFIFRALKQGQAGFTGVDILGSFPVLLNTQTESMKP